MMKIDKKQSLKNIIGVIACSSLLALSLTPLTANAEENNISIDYINYFSKTGKEIIFIPSGGKGKDEIDFLIKYTDDDIIEINGVNYSKHQLQNAVENKTNRKQKMEQVLGSMLVVGPNVTVVVTCVLLGIHEYKKKTINRKDHNGFVRYIR